MTIALNARNRTSLRSRKVLCIAMVLFSVALTFGKSIKLMMSWRNPAASAGKFHRVLALGLSDNTEIRADFEDDLAAQLTSIGVEAIPGHTILLRPESAPLDEDYLKTQVREHEIDAIVVSRLLKVENTTTYIPGSTYTVPYTYYNNFYGYYGRAYAMVETPGYLRTEKKVRIETNLYTTSSPEGELVWTGITDTFNPSKPDKAIKRLVKLVVKEMRAEGVL